MCGLTVTEFIARAQRRDPAEVGYYRLRFPAKPVPLSDLASLASTPEAEDSVVRLPHWYLHFQREPPLLQCTGAGRRLSACA